MNFAKIKWLKANASSSAKSRKCFPNPVVYGDQVGLTLSCLCQSTNIGHDRSASRSNEEQVCIRFDEDIGCNAVRSLT
jgi:hypothetical protein